MGLLFLLLVGRKNRRGFCSQLISKCSNLNRAMNFDDRFKRALSYIRQRLSFQGLRKQYHYKVHYLHFVFGVFCS